MSQSRESLGFNLPLLLCWESEITADNAVALQLWACPVIVLAFMVKGKRAGYLSSCTITVSTDSWVFCPPTSNNSGLFIYFF